MPQSSRGRSRTLLIGLAAVAVISGGTAAWFVAQGPDTPSVIQPGDNGPAIAREKVQVYWLISDDTEDGTELVLAPTTIELSLTGTTPDVILQGAVERLLQGPANQDVSTTIPENTRLNRFELKEDGIHVDLSQEFTLGGGSTSMQGRLGQVIYTATALDPNAPVWISVAGEPLRVLGGEGLEVSQPITRQEFQEDFALGQLVSKK